MRDLHNTVAAVAIMGFPKLAPV